MEHSPHFAAPGLSQRLCQSPLGQVFNLLTLVTDQEAASAPKAFTIDSGIPELNLPEMTDAVSDGGAGRPRAGSQFPEGQRT